MKYLTNKQVCHAFVYHHEGDTYSNPKSSISFSDGKLFSYNTIIAKRVLDKKGNHCFLVSATNFSNTTAKHISNLLHSIPCENLVIRVPIYYEQQEVNSRLLAGAFSARLSRLVNTGSSKRKDRQEFIDIYTSYKHYCLNIEDIKLTTLCNFEAFFDECQEKEATLNKRYEEKQQKLKERQQRLEEEKTEAWYACQNILETITQWQEPCGLHNRYFEAVRALYSSNHPSSKTKQVAEAKIRYFKQVKVLSYSAPAYVIPYGDKVKTTKGLTFNNSIVKTFLQRFKEGRVGVGQHFQCYTILAINRDMVVIGCHRIPMQNIEMLMDYYNI